VSTEEVNLMMDALTMSDRGNREYVVKRAVFITNEHDAKTREFGYAAMHRLLPTMKRQTAWYARAYPETGGKGRINFRLCPRCEKEEESQDHLLQCRECDPRREPKWLPRGNSNVERIHRDY
ncbi:hypothetical protein GGI12_005695, partial [Dipsacomyces acuminosporus]